MGDEERIDTMLKAFMKTYNLPTEQFPYFDSDRGYFLIHKGNRIHEEVSDAWDWFQKGWDARENVDARTVEGW
jgi:hypothetical protein